MLNICRVTVYALIIAVVGWGQQGAIADDDAAEPDLKVRLTSKCAVQQDYPELAPLAAAILAPLAVAALEKSIDAAGVALVAAGKDRTETYSATGSYSFYDVNGKDIKLAGKRRCLTVFKEGHSKMLTGDWTLTSRSPKIVGLGADPDFYFEAYFEESPDRTAFRISPAYIEYNNNLWDSTWTDTRDIIITFDFSRPSNEQGKSFASSVFSISGIRPGQNLDSKRTKGAYMPLPAIDEQLKASLARLEQAARERDQLQRTPTNEEKELSDLQKDLVAVTTKDSKKVQDLRLRIARLERLVKLQSIDRELGLTKPAEQGGEKKIEVVPVNVNVTVAETRDGSELLLAVGQILQGASPDIKAAGKKVINDALLPSAIEAKKVAKQASQLGVLTSDLEVLENAKKVAELPVDALPEARAVAEQNLRIAQYKANIAYQAAGLSAPYPDARP